MTCLAADVILLYLIHFYIATLLYIWSTIPLLSVDSCMYFSTPPPPTHAGLDCVHLRTRYYYPYYTHVSVYTGYPLMLLFYPFYQFTVFVVIEAPEK